MGPVVRRLNGPKSMQSSFYKQFAALADHMRSVLGDFPCLVLRFVKLHSLKYSAIYFLYQIKYFTELGALFVNRFIESSLFPYRFVH